MPTLSMFLGILIKMNWMDAGQHSEPHFHAFYGEYEASFSLDGEILAGEFPKKQAAFVRAWALMHEEELAAGAGGRGDLPHRPVALGGTT